MGCWNRGKTQYIRMNRTKDYLTNLPGHLALPSVPATRPGHPAQPPGPGQPQPSPATRPGPGRARYPARLSSLAMGPATWPGPVTWPGLAQLPGPAKQPGHTLRFRNELIRRKILRPFGVKCNKSPARINLSQTELIRRTKN